MATPQQRAVDGPNASENGGAAQHDRSNRQQLVARARIRFRLTKMRRVDQGSGEPPPSR